MKINDLSHIETVKENNVRGAAFSSASANGIGLWVNASAGTYARRSYYYVSTRGYANASALFGAVSAHSFSAV